MIRDLWTRFRKAWHRFWVNPESEWARIGQLDMQYGPGSDRVSEQGLVEILKQHYWYTSRDGEAGCNCSFSSMDMTRDEWLAHVAAVIAAAKLAIVELPEPDREKPVSGGSGSDREDPLTHHQAQT